MSRLRIAVHLVGDLAAELVAGAELLAHGLDDVVGVAVGLGEDQRLGNLLAAREDLRQLAAEGADYGADLVRIHYRAVQLLGAVCLVLVLDLPALPARQPFALLDGPARLDLATALGLLGLDDVHLVADVDPVGDGLLMRILADHVLPEEPVSTVVGGGGQADQVGVEVLQHLAPQVVDRAVALVDDDEVEELGRQRGVVDHRRWVSRPRQPRRVQGRQPVQPFAEGIGLGYPLLHRRRPLEAEHLAGARHRIGAIREAGHHPGALVHEGQRLPIVDPLECRRGIGAGLVLYVGDPVPPLFPLRFDHADRPPVDEQHVVRRPTSVGYSRTAIPTPAPKSIFPIDCTRHPACSSFVSMAARACCSGVRLWSVINATSYLWRDRVAVRTSYHNGLLTGRRSGLVEFSVTSTKT